jgi:hypothetical protein
MGSLIEVSLSGLSLFRSAGLDTMECVLELTAE